MISYEKNTLTVATFQEEPILSWAVWFVTDEGTFPSIELAKESCDRTGRPYYAIIPVPVAVGQRTYEIAMRG